MANKVNKTTTGRSPALGVKMASPAAIMVATTKAAMLGNEVEEEDLKAVIAGLRTELDTERRKVRQLRRERDAEVLKVRNEEQTKMSIALKDQSKKLLEEKQREVELQRDLMKSKYESDQSKVVKLKDREITKLRGDLARCQDELKEELSKRGLSTSARASFDTERQKLLQEVRDLQLAKRQLEERLTEAGETEKRLQQEIRRLQEFCKLEVARVEREANLEVKKLLEELKTKDHMLEQMDRSIYPDRATILKNRLEKLSIEEMLNLNTTRWSQNYSCRYSSSTSYISRDSNTTGEQYDDKMSCATDSDISDATGDSSCKCSRSEKSESGNALCHCNEKKSCNVENAVAGLNRCSDSSHSYCTRSSSCSNTSVPNDSGGSKIGSKKRSRSASALGRSPKTGALQDSSKTKNTCNTSNNNKAANNNGNGVARPASATPIISSTSSVPSRTDHCVTSGGCALQTLNLQKKLYETERRVKLAEGLNRAVVEKNNTLSASGKQLENKIKSLSQHINNMKIEHDTNQKEIRRLNDVIVGMKGKYDGSADGDLSLELEYCRQRCAELEQVLVSLRRDCLDKDHRIGLLVKSQQKPRHKHEPKTVRFMLPDDTDEKTSDISEEDLNTDTSSSCSDPVQSEELLIQSVHKDYEVLMEEHLKLQKYCATLVQSQSTNNISINQELHVKRESLDIAVQVMEEKLRMSEEREQKLKQQLQEVYDQNEELEFRVLELEEFADKSKSASSIDDDNHLSRRNQQLEMEVERLRHRLAQYEHLDIIELEKDARSPCNPLEVTSCTGDHQRLSVENLRKLTVSLSDSDKENQMVQSFSTMTSGFDEISCISLELDDRTEMPDMPGEEEADLERDADDIGPEMPTEECDDILEISDSKLEHSNENILDLLQTVVDKPILSDSLINSTSCQTANALLVAIEKRHCTDRNSPALQNFESCNEECNMNEFVENDMSMKEITESKSQRILDLEDQVDILEHVDSTYSKTIDTLNQIEQQLQIIIPSEHRETEPLVDDEGTTNYNVEVFWPNTSEEIVNSISIMEGQVINLVPQEHDSIAVTEAKMESRNSISRCINALHDAIVVVQKENASCTELEKRIECFQQEQLHSEENLNELFRSCESCTKDEAFQPSTFPLVKQNDSSILGSLKRLAFDAVTAGFRTEFLELRALTHEFFSAADEDELNDIAFIDEDDAACVQSDASTPAEKDMPSKLQQRTELRLNTKMSSLNQRFDFLSPTSFDNPDWNSASHLETVNQCLLLQMEELEKERDSLKDIVCRDDAVINEMTQKISILENSEHELKKIVDRLEEADELAGEHVCRLEADCQRLRAKLSRAESIESSLRAEMEAQGKREAEMEAKLLRSVESLEHTTNKLRCNLNEVEKEKQNAIKHAEDLNAFVVSLKQKETFMLQRIKSYESLNKNLKEKTSELETSLSLAYDEVAGLRGQKDSLIQRLNSITAENKDLVRENEELIGDKKNLVADIENLTESENFLREANRKMWLSLKANIEEMEKIEDRSCKRCSLRFDDNEGPENKSNMTSPVDKILEENSTQTDKCDVSSIRTKDSPNKYSGLQQVLNQLSQKDHSTTVLILNLISDLLCSYSLQRTSTGSSLSRGSLESEKKARAEEMLKFVASTRLRGSANSLKSATSSAAEKRTSNGGGFGEDVSDLDPVDEEEEFWSVVENYEDIYDIRAADTWNLWRHLEQDIMGLNLDQLRKLLQEREAEKSCQTSLSELRQAASTSTLEQSTQCDLEGQHEASTIPPLPTSLPPRDESQTEQGTQTEMVEPTATSQVEPTEDSSALRHLLNHNERTISAQKNEVDRLTVEMRSWQQRALEASDQVSRLTTELSTARQQIESTKYRPVSGLKTPTSSITDSKFQPAINPSDRKSRIELSSSQIPVSVKRAVDFYSSISDRSGSTSSSSSQTSPRSRTTSTSPGPARASPSLRTASTSPFQTSSTYRTTLVSPGQAPTGSRTISFIPRYVQEKANGQHETAATATTQGPLSNGSSSSEHQQQELPASQIPRLLPEWIQQQQQQLQQLRDQQLCEADNVERNIAEDQSESVAGSSPSLQQLPAAADIPAAAEISGNAAAASETQTEVPLLSDDVIDASANGREF